ncbi:TPA: hypothetical protein SAN82_003632 [Pseudomonas putida]|nr:hypothetical protein [Pseudomonas putida]
MKFEVIGKDGGRNSKARGSIEVGGSEKMFDTVDASPTADTLVAELK